MSRNVIICRWCGSPNAPPLVHVNFGKDVSAMRKPKMRFCFNCGAELDYMSSTSAYADRLDTCGSKECERAARDAALQEREEAHEQLDRDMGWFRCTKETPWRPELGTPVEHDAVHEVGDQEDGYPGGDIVTYECRNCGHRWRAELPQ